MSPGQRPLTGGCSIAQLVQGLIRPAFTTIERLRLRRERDATTQFRRAITSVQSDERIVGRRQHQTGASTAGRLIHNDFRAMDKQVLPDLDLRVEPHAGTSGLGFVMTYFQRTSLISRGNSRQLERAFHPDRTVQQAIDGFDVTSLEHRIATRLTIIAGWALRKFLLAQKLEVPSDERRRRIHERRSVFSAVGQCVIVAITLGVRQISQSRRWIRALGHAVAARVVRIILVRIAVRVSRRQRHSSLENEAPPEIPPPAV